MVCLNQLNGRSEVSSYSSKMKWSISKLILNINIGVITENTLKQLRIGILPIYCIVKQTACKSQRSNTFMRNLRVNFKSTLKNIINPLYVVHLNQFIHIACHLCKCPYQTSTMLPSLRNSLVLIYLILLLVIIHFLIK